MRYIYLLSRILAAPPQEKSVIYHSPCGIAFYYMTIEMLNRSQAMKEHYQMNTV